MPHPKPITYQECKICENLRRVGLPNPVIGEFIPQKSLNHNRMAPFHNWYYFTLGYSPKFVEYVIKTKGINKENTILDPFVGCGTTLVESKLNGIRSIGIDANNIMAFASKVKTKWDIDINDVKTEQKRIFEHPAIKMISPTNIGSFLPGNDNINIPEIEINQSMQDALKRRYISRKPLIKALTLLSEINKIKEQENRDFFRLALFSILVPISNVRFGPGFGIGPIKSDIDVVGQFKEKTNRMISDLTSVKNEQVKTPSEAMIGDSRKLSESLKEKIDFVITSPPYPGDHEYTRHTRLELIFSGIETRDDIRDVKKRMIRGSTRSVYKEDKETQKIEKFPEIIEIMNEIDKRVKETNGTSGFEKLYSKVVGEYFGGMYEFLKELKINMNNGGVASLLVGDSHAFKMVHIETARILGEMAIEVGFSKYDLEMWWNKRSTAHSFLLPEYILHIYHR